MSADAELKEKESGNDLTDWLRRLWPTSVIVGVVLATVFGGLLLAYQDVPEEHPPPVVVRPTPTQTPLPTVTPVPPPTSTPTQTPLPTVTLVPLPISTPTSPPSLTPTPSPTVEIPTATWTPQATPTPTLTPTSTATPPCAPPASWWLYTVQPGDTLLILATRYGTSTGAIMQANCLSSPTLYPGQQLYLPPVNITPTPTLSPTPSVYITPTPTLSPTPSVYITPTPTLSPTPCEPPADWQIYVVQRGDTLYSLALRYNTTVYAIVQANCLTSYTIYVGQNLYLPPLPDTPTPTVTHTPTSTPTATWTPTFTATPTATATPTITPTATETPTTVPTDGYPYPIALGYPHRRAHCYIHRLPYAHADALGYRHALATPRAFVSVPKWWGSKS